MRFRSSACKYLIFAALVAAPAYACGSGDDESGSGAATPLPSTSIAPATISTGSLPSGFPDDFPVYAGATPISGSESVNGIVASLDTPASFADVAAFYRDALPRSPWQILEEEPTAGQEGVLFTFENEDDESRGGTLSIVRPADHLRTIIYVSFRTTPGG